MSWFSSNKKTDVHRTINRLLNANVSLESHLSVAPSADNRNDIRVSRTTPVVILTLSNDHLEEGEEQLTLGLTHDLSSEGMAISSLGEIQTGVELAVGIGSEDEFSVLLCECVRSKPLGFGFHQSGVQIHEVLPSRDFIPLKNFAHYLESSSSKNILSMLKD